MRVYMLPVTVTATLMSAHLTLATRAQRVTRRSLSPLIGEAGTKSREPAEVQR